MKATQEQEKKVDLRLVDVIVRIAEKRNGKLTGVVIYLVRPSEKTLAQEPETQPYKVVFFDGKFQSCTCKGGRGIGHCYHGEGLQMREQARVEQDELPKMQTSQKGTLNGSSQGFSLLK